MIGRQLSAAEGAGAVPAGQERLQLPDDLKEGQAAALAGGRRRRSRVRNAVRDRDERDVVVPARVGAALEVVKAERVLELAVVLLDPEAHLRQPHQLLERGVGG